MIIFKSVSQQKWICSCNGLKDGEQSLLYSWNAPYTINKTLRSIAGWVTWKLISLQGPIFQVNFEVILPPSSGEQKQLDRVLYCNFMCHLDFSLKQPHWGASYLPSHFPYMNKHMLQSDRLMRRRSIDR